MPGITGIINRTSADQNREALGTMISCMMHEHFYSSGTYINEQIGVFIGWVSHKDSFSDCMPVWNEKKNLVLIFFGENFTDKDLFDQLKGKHHKFDNSNASYLIHLYEEKGIDFIKDLNGWFCGMLIDLRLNKLILFNDRYAMQKIFYYESKNAFYFSSEAKALLKVCPELRELDMRGLGELIACDCVLEYRTLFKNVSLLPAASVWEFQDAGIVDKREYFNPDSWENQPWLEKEFFYEKLEDTFVKILPRYFRSKQPIGISLTGGLDTRMIMANMIMSAGKYPCYTFGSMYRDCSDVKVARKTADTIQQTHQIIPVGKDFLKNFAIYAEKTVYITDGYLDLGGSPEVYVNKIAREIAPIRMTGNFGSEVLRNIRWLKFGHPNEKAFHPDFQTMLHNASETLANINRRILNPLSFTLFIETPWFGNNRLVSEQSQLTLRAPYLDNELVALMYRAPMGVRNSKELSLRLIENGSEALRAIPTDRGYGGNAILPLAVLARLYHQFLFKAEYAYNYGMPQWLATIDYVFKFMHFEKFFLGRHKFTHFRIWYRDELADYVRAILLDERTLKRPYLNGKYVEEIVKKHTKGYRNYTTEITKLLTVELVQRLLIEQS